VCVCVCVLKRVVSERECVCVTFIEIDVFSVNFVSLNAHLIKKFFLTKTFLSFAQTREKDEKATRSYK